MVLGFLSRTPLRHLVRRDTPPADSPVATSQSSQGGSSNGARADVARTKTKETELILEDLEKNGVEIDDKIASIIDDEVARIKAEAAREKINEPIKIRAIVLDTVGCVAEGFVMGVVCYEFVVTAIFGILAVSLVQSLERFSSSTKERDNK